MNFQAHLSETLIPSLVNQLFTGTDATFVALGAKSQCKESILYDNKENKAGLFQGVVSALFEKVEELKTQQLDGRHQVRMSAIIYSQRDATVLDLLSQFNSEEPETYRTSHLLIFLSLYAFRTGTNTLEGGRSRLALIDLGIGERNSMKGDLTMPAIGGILLALCQGQKYIPARENALSLLLKYSLSTARLSQFLFSFGEKQDDNENIVQLASKLSRTKKAANNLALKREKPSSDGASVSSNERRRRELESGSEFSAPETVIFLGPSGGSSSEKSGTPLQTPRTLRRTTSSGLSGVSIPSSARSPSANSTRLTGTSDSSIRTCTGSIPPMLKDHTPFLSPTLKLYDDLCSPPSTSATNMTYPDMTAFGGKSNQDRDDFGITIASPKKSKNRYNLDDGKRQAIINWMENCDPPLNENEFYLDEKRECGILTYPLEDIIEQEEESSRTNSTSKSKRDHPLRILSKECLEKVDSLDTMQETLEEFTRVDDEETKMQEALERALEAATVSISSLRSHEILTKLNGDLSQEMTNTISVTATTGTPSETDMYRRASHLEEYAMQRAREMEQKSKKKSRLGLNCCQASMASSTSTAPNDCSQRDEISACTVEKSDDDRRKEDLRRRREALKLEEFEIKREKRILKKELEEKPSLAKQVTLQLHQLAMPSKSHRPRITSDSLPTTPTHSHRKMGSASPQRPHYTSPVHQSHQSLPRHSKIASSNNQTQNGSVSHKQRQDGSSSRKTSRTRQEKSEKRDHRDRERRPSLPKDQRSVPVDDMPIRSPYAKMTSPKQSAGTSSGRGSEDNSSSLVKCKRQSYSASSGYESDPYSRIEKMGAALDKKMSLNREVELLKERQRRLKIELKEAKERIGQIEDVKTLGFHRVPNNVSPTTLADALVQENRILEKRLIACRNHTMLVTTFL
ncbi:hypothetical protein WR25_25831 [Diploscapter pachys]|uniref:Kinesin motor domain-containing protein n=1 Tax=Diploscapter pachys TaxID=2018661 RepID=A0A2A2JMF7_9BILA|nr:hypothetical protein WR25_25831 [Diploscapter pachys]